MVSAVSPRLPPVNSYQLATTILNRQLLPSAGPDVLCSQSLSGAPPQSMILQMSPIAQQKNAQVLVCVSNCLSWLVASQYCRLSTRNTVSPSGVLPALSLTQGRSLHHALFISWLMNYCGPLNAAMGALRRRRGEKAIKGIAERREAFFLVFQRPDSQDSRHRTHTRLLNHSPGKLLDKTETDFWLG